MHLYCSGTTVNCPYYRVSTIAGLTVSISFDGEVTNV